MKKSLLTIKQINQYNKNGYIAPIDILSLEQVKETREEIENVEKKWPYEINELNRNNIHYYSPIFDQIVHNFKILDVVKNINYLFWHLQALQDLFPLLLPSLWVCYPTF